MESFNYSNLLAHPLCYPRFSKMMFQKTVAQLLKDAATDLHPLLDLTVLLFLPTDAAAKAEGSSDGSIPTDPASK